MQIRQLPLPPTTMPDGSGATVTLWADVSY
jgi:hypothetical protein